MKITIRTILFGLICCAQFLSTNAQQLMTNVYGRNRQLLRNKRLESTLKRQTFRRFDRSKIGTATRILSTKTNL